MTGTKACKTLSLAILIAGILPLFIFLSAPASASITITPTIVVLEGRQRFVDVNLVNTSDKTRSYELSWEFKKMVEGEGNYLSVKESTTEFDLTKHIVFTPKRITLQPREAQKIRLALRYTGEPPPPGDYRAHLKFSDVGEVMTEEERQRIRAQTEPGRNVVGVGVRVGFSIPVILRVGEPDDQITIGDVKTQVNTKTAKLETMVPIKKTSSSFGVHGVLQVFHDGPEGEKMIGEIRNANLFAEVNERLFRVVLRTNDLSRGSLRVVFKDQDRTKNTIYAEKNIPIAP